jgi:hypothetical protein
MADDRAEVSQSAAYLALKERACQTRVTLVQQGGSD